ncbi:hypothetical protein HKD37_20G056265 [Glycine soja]
MDKGREGGMTIEGGFPLTGFLLNTPLGFFVGFLRSKLGLAAKHCDVLSLSCALSKLSQSLTFSSIFASIFLKSTCNFLLLNPFHWHRVVHSHGAWVTGYYGSCGYTMALRENYLAFTMKIICESDSQLAIDLNLGSVNWFHLYHSLILKFRNFPWDHSSNQVYRES